jgi:predicted nuclease of restriction endonuclease-like (RecB) superfamily
MRVEEDNAIAYYCEESRNENWSVRQLERNIKSNYYSRLLSTQNKTKVTDNEKTLDFIKDPYVLEFLQIPENNVKESVLEELIDVA